MHDIICKVSKSLVTVLQVVGVKFSACIGGDSAGKDVEESCFPCTTGSHDGCDLTSFDYTADSFKNSLLLVCFFTGYVTLVLIVRDINRVVYVLEYDIDSISGILMH